MIRSTWQTRFTTKFLLKIIEENINRKKCEAWIGCGQRTKVNTFRFPDLIVASRKYTDAHLHEPAVLEEPALLIVEVTSPATSDIDYREKAKEYASIGVPEYWIADHIRKTVELFSLANGNYNRQTFTLADTVESPTLGRLKFAVGQLFDG